LFDDWHHETSGEVAESASVSMPAPYVYKGMMFSFLLLLVSNVLPWPLLSVKATIRPKKY
jgi:hypothetical protein